MNLIYTIYGLYLIISSCQDIKTKTISARLSAFTSVIILIMEFAYGLINMKQTILAFIPVLILLLLSYLTKQALGYGDCLVFLVGCLVFNLSSIVLLIATAFIISGLFSLGYAIKNNSSKGNIPFVPFILIAYVFIRCILI